MSSRIQASRARALRTQALNPRCILHACQLSAMQEPLNKLIFSRLFGKITSMQALRIQAFDPKATYFKGYKPQTGHICHARHLGTI